ncbi:hypothetical protein AQUCO_01100525v1 [Aquilegia coerulea]|uniref:Uncharacterized protein n=1 Tax=Aquilegia coerulea TaxID=218851 RepID=A0A2G5E836_AQUCA|nr:hypothetical protein AQUCO_01100525v1 [Aquilegia coerulea]
MRWFLSSIMFISATKQNEIQPHQFLDFQNLCAHQVFRVAHLSIPILNLLIKARFRRKRAIDSSGTLHKHTCTKSTSHYVSAHLY